MKASETIYLDNHATTHCDSEVIDIIGKTIANRKIGNPHSSEHNYGWEAEKAISESSEIIAKHINSLPSEVFFTSGATEANNIAILGIARNAIPKTDKKTIITSNIEHKCVIESVLETKKLYGFTVKLVPVSENGIIDIDDLEKLINDDTLLVSIAHTNGEIGTMQPILEIGKLCKKYGAIFHVDASQAIYSKIDVLNDNIDLLSMSAHKFYGPVGVGFLYINDQLSVRPSSVYMGGQQQDGVRSGTISVALVVGMAKAIEILETKSKNEIKHLKFLKNTFLEQLDLYNIKYKINGSSQARHPGNLNIQLINNDAKELIYKMQPYVAISTGSACNSGVIESSYVLNAIGLSENESSESVRIGFGRFNTKQEILEFAKLLKSMIS